MTPLQDQRLTVTGFSLSYVGLMTLLASFTSPHFDGLRHVTTPILSAVVGVGIVLLATANIGARLSRNSK